ncbi:MAG: bifunctional phosphoribosyl-AMP cyclohydrolase/phosphoribosyl-ATP diphosphatase HisIE [Oscillospiraceae bacterium]|jgi:phosphoribosyl-ATP pyrophosphohydrolase/phosphoribosyl-AMP cyclohydrolase|nr:bifunctional phosphoribosyl-AMP cyclohydrolase/phosphoribosyl-ATP diphosphatase HisIE [Oscillospiraceae bacterium]
MDNIISTTEDINTLKFGTDGLIPAIVIDAETKNVLTLAYMNRQSLEITLEEGYTCFWSRSRSELWRKGETSGNKQRVIELRTDCDRDALVVSVDKAGPACHTGEDSCFGFDGGAEGGVIDSLYALLLDRKANPKEGSYTTYLFEKGLDKILKKIGEESTEVIIGAKNRDKQETVYELADLMYHALVLMTHDGITPDDVRAELEKRHVVDKKVKQEKMN